MCLVWKNLNFFLVFIPYQEITEFIMLQIFFVCLVTLCKLSITKKHEYILLKNHLFQNIVAAPGF